MIKELKKTKLSAPIFVSPGDTIIVRQTGYAGGKQVLDKKLMDYTIKEGDPIRDITHVVVISVENELGLSEGIGCILGKE